MMTQLKKRKMKQVKNNRNVMQKMVIDRFFKYKNMVLYKEASCNIAIIFLVLIILGLIIGEYYTE